MSSAALASLPLAALPRPWKGDTSHIKLVRNEAHDINRACASSDVTKAHYIVGEIHKARANAAKKLGRTLSPQEAARIEAPIIVDKVQQWACDRSIRTTQEGLQRLGNGLFKRRETKRGNGQWMFSMDENTWPALPDHVPERKPPASSDSLSSTDDDDSLEDADSTGSYDGNVGRRKGVVERGQTGSNGSAPYRRSRVKYRLVEQPLELQPGQPSKAIEVPPDADEIEKVQFDSDANLKVEPIIQSGILRCKIRDNRPPVICISCKRQVEQGEIGAAVAASGAPLRAAVAGHGVVPVSNYTARFDAYLEAVTRAKLPATTVDLQDAETEWGALSVTDRIAALQGIEQRITAGEFDEERYRPRPDNYLKRRAWERPIRKSKASVFDEAQGFIP